MKTPELQQSVTNRRKFIANGLAIAGGLALIDLQSSFASFSSDKNYTVQDIINLILKEGGLSPLPNTVDTLKSGKADMVVTSIVTTMFATVAVIEQAVKVGANFIIAHEPTFYNHRDDPNWVKNNAIVKQKQDLLAKHNITVWRFHDYIHSLTPDAVSYGVAKKMNWLPYFKTDREIITIPPVTLKTLVQQFKKALNIPHLRVIGDLQQECKQIALIPGAAGGQEQVGAVETEHPDVLIIGELSEWKTAEYIRDSNALGKKVGLIVLGHQFSEDPGMEYFVDWLQPKLPGMKITHIPSGEPFMWM